MIIMYRPMGEVESETFSFKAILKIEYKYGVIMNVTIFRMEEFHPIGIL